MSRFYSIITAFSALLWIAIILVILSGNTASPQIISWKVEKNPLVEKKGQIIIEFNRLMNHQSVESGIKITPEIPYKISWTGRKMALTPEIFFTSETEYTVQFNSGNDLQNNSLSRAFEFTFSTSPRQILFIGTGEEEGQLFLFHITSQKKEILSPKDLFVMSFTPHPQGKKIFFFAIPHSKISTKYQPEDMKELYELDLENKTVTLLSDSDQFVNVAFDISKDGRVLALSRVKIDNERNFQDYGIFLKKEGEELFEKFWNTSILGEPLFLTAHGTHILGVDENGFVLCPMDQENGTVEVIGNFLDSFGFNSDGSKALFLSLPEEGIVGDQNEFVVFDKNGSLEKGTTFQGMVAQAEISDKNRKIFFILQYFDSENNVERKMFVYDFTTKKTSQILETSKAFTQYFDISPDEQWLVIAQNTSSQNRSELILVNKNNFQEQTTLPVSGTQPQFLR